MEGWTPHYQTYLYTKNNTHEDIILLGHFCDFYLTLWNSFLVSHYYREEFIVDPNHHYYRRFTQRYKRKQSIVKSLWIAAGLTVAAFPLLHLLIFITMLTTFLSFSILDETE